MVLTRDRPGSLAAGFGGARPVVRAIENEEGPPPIIEQQPPQVVVEVATTPAEEIKIGKYKKRLGHLMNMEELLIGTLATTVTGHLVSFSVKHTLSHAEYEFWVAIVLLFIGISGLFLCLINTSRLGLWFAFSIGVAKSLIVALGIDGAVGRMASLFITVNGDIGYFLPILALTGSVMVMRAFAEYQIQMILVIKKESPTVRYVISVGLLFGAALCFAILFIGSSSAYGSLRENTKLRTSPMSSVTFNGPSDIEASVTVQIINDNSGTTFWSATTSHENLLVAIPVDGYLKSNQVATLRIKRIGSVDKKVTSADFISIKWKLGYENLIKKIAIVINE